MLNKLTSFSDKLFIAGAGGQGILQLGRIIAQSAVEENKYTTYYPSYGAEIRGGVANCTVIISDREIVSPVVSNPESMIIMNNQSLLKFSNKLVSDGLLIINSSLIKLDSQFNKTVELIKITATEIAEKIGNIKCANIAMLGAYVEKKKTVSKETVISVIEKVFKADPKIVSMNIKALEEGITNV